MILAAIAEVIAEICALVEGPISAEAVSLDFETMVKEGDKLAAIAPNVVVKLPLTWDGLRACRVFTDKGIKTNVTLCFAAAQALMAAKAGATFVSPFVGRTEAEAREKNIGRSCHVEALFSDDECLRVDDYVRSTAGSLT